MKRQERSRFGGRSFRCELQRLERNKKRGHTAICEKSGAAMPSMLGFRTLGESPKYFRIAGSANVRPLPMSEQVCFCDLGATGHGASTALVP